MFRPEDSPWLNVATNKRVDTHTCSASGTDSANPPKLDGTLCTCSCEKASLVRSDVERKVGVPVEEAVRIWCPRWQRECYTKLV